MGRVIQSFFGGGPKEKKVDPAPREDLEGEKKRTGSQRAALFKTEGGAAGEELGEENGVRRRNTLFGN